VARYNDGRSYPWGNIIGTDIHFNNSTDGGGFSSAVGSYALNGNSKTGVCDLLGNIVEWCNDYYSGYIEEDQTNPLGPSSGSSKVMKGKASNGTYHNALRSLKSLTSYKKYTGFRIVKQH